MQSIGSVVLCLPVSVPFFDPDPELTDRMGIRLVDEWDDTVFGVVGWSDAGLAAVDLAANHSDLPRLVIMSTPFPDVEDPGTRSVDPSKVAAKTLLIFGSADPLTGHSHGAQWQKRLPNARLEMVPGGDHDLLTEKWKRVLSFLAPRGRAATLA